jgi:hypothetical protein
VDDAADFYFLEDYLSAGYYIEAPLGHSPTHCMNKSN